MQEIEGISGLLYGFYFIWPFLVSIFLLWKNSLLIEKKISFLIISILLNYSLLLPFAIGMTFLFWMFLSALLGFALPGKVIVCIVAIGIYLLVLSVHIFVTKQLVKKYS